MEEGEEAVALRERLAARERENLALLQSLHGLQVQCSRLESDCQALAARVAPEAASTAPEHVASVSPADVSVAASLRLRNEPSAIPRAAEIDIVGDDAQGEEWTFDAVLGGDSLAEDAEERKGAAYWRGKAVTLEQLLAVAARKNLAFEDAVARLEAQVRVLERHSDALRLVPVAKGRRSGVGSAATASKTVSSAILSLSSASISPAVACQQEALAASRSDAIQGEVERLRADIAKRKQEAARLRSAIQRKGELLAHEKAKTASLQQRLSSISSSADDLAEAQAQCAELRAKVKEQARQLQDVRLAGSACHDDNLQLSFRLQQSKKEFQDAATRIKALQTENQRLRVQLADAASVGGSDVGSSSRSSTAKKSGRSAPGSNEATTGVEEEIKALRRRVLQKQELVVKGKAQTAALEEELARERAAVLKLEKSNRQLQQSLKTQLATSTRTASLVQTESQAQLSGKQQQLDGLRASVYDVFEAFVCCFEPARGARRSERTREGMTTIPATASNQDDASRDSSDDERLDKARRWTDFSLDDLATLHVSKSAKQTARAIEAEVEDSTCAQLEAKVALRALDKALDRWPEDCRAEICRVLESMFNQRRQR